MQCLGLVCKKRLHSFRFCFSFETLVKQEQQKQINCILSHQLLLSGGRKKKQQTKSPKNISCSSLASEDRKTTSNQQHLTTETGEQFF